VAKWLREKGVQKGDRVASVLPNIPEAVVAFLATQSIGAVWSSCSPDFGNPSIEDRFVQISANVVFVCDE
jgi:acetoacetyl-CoA synthetase